MRLSSSIREIWKRKLSQMKDIIIMLKWDDWLKQQVRYSRPGRESWRNYAECRQRHEKYGERDIWGNMAKTKI